MSNLKERNYASKQNKFSYASQFAKKKSRDAMISPAKNIKITGFWAVTISSQVDIYQCSKGIMVNIYQYVCKY
jgi:hypothetical protein